MPYTRINYRTKKALREALDAGKEVEVYQPGPFGSDVPDGITYIEGPHYPEAHKWYASVHVKNGVAIKGTLK